MEAISKADDDEKTTKNEHFKMEDKAELDTHVKQKNPCNENPHKSHAETWDRCSIVMKNKIENRSDCCNDILMT